jgi:hypothetical protein
MRKSLTTNSKPKQKPPAPSFHQQEKTKSPFRRREVN